MNQKNLNDLMAGLPGPDPKLPGVAEVAAMDIDAAADALLWIESDPDDDDAAVDVLAGWMRIRRMDPDLLASADREKVAARLDAYVLTNDQVLSERVTAYLTPLGWLAETQSMLEAHLNLQLEPDEAQDIFTRLFRDFDDCCLSLAAMSALGHDWEKPAGEALLCKEFLEENPDVFLPAHHFVRQWFAGFRSDLVENCPELAITLLPFEVTLRSYAGMIREMTREPVFSPAALDVLESLIPDVFTEMIERLKKVSRTALEKLNFSLEDGFFSPPGRIWGAGSSAVAGEKTRAFEWRFEDAGLAAVVRLTPGAALGENEVVFHVFDLLAEWLFFAGMLFPVEPDSAGTPVAKCPVRWFIRATENDAQSCRILTLVMKDGVIRTAAIEITG